LNEKQLNSVLDYILQYPEATHQDIAKFGYELAHEEIEKLQLQVKELREQLNSLLSNKL